MQEREQIKSLRLCLIWEGNSVVKSKNQLGLALRREVRISETTPCRWQSPGIGWIEKVFMKENKEHSTWRTWVLEKQGGKKNQEAKEWSEGWWRTWRREHEGQEQPTPASGTEAQVFLARHWDFPCLPFRMRQEILQPTCTALLSKCPSMKLWDSKCKSQFPDITQDGCL